MENTNSENCGPGCNCGKTSANSNTKAKAVLCLIVLLAIGGIFVYKTKIAKQVNPVNSATAFTLPVVNEVNEPKPAISTTNKQEPVSQPIEENKTVGKLLDSLASLNKIAINQDSVLVFIPANANAMISKQTTDIITSAMQKIESSSKAKLGLYTLQTSSPEYANIAAQMKLPGIVIMSKGRGMGGVSGEITEDKLLQAYVASTRAGGCGPSGCGTSSECGPSSSSCAPATPVGPVR